MSRWASAGAAVASPFVSSVFMSGYEQRAYIFLGYGLWTQLFAMWCLPIAWGLTWRAINRRETSPCSCTGRGSHGLHALRDRLPSAASTFHLAVARPRGHEQAYPLRASRRSRSAPRLGVGLGSPARTAQVVGDQLRARRDSVPERLRSAFDAQVAGGGPHTSTRARSCR